MRLHLVDGTFELFRAHYGKRPGHTSPDGRDLKATVGVVASLLALSEVYGQPRARAFAYPQRVAAVRPREVWALAQALFRPEAAARCVVRAPGRKKG